jgi:hypothetical protein
VACLPGAGGGGGPDRVKFNVNLVLIDFFLRHGLLEEKGPAAEALRAG